MEQMQKETRTKTSAGTRWIIGGGGESVKPAKHEIPGKDIKNLRKTQVKTQNHPVKAHNLTHYSKRAALVERPLILPVECCV
jgi:hypothetical protein